MKADGDRWVAQHSRQHTIPTAWELKFWQSKLCRASKLIWISSEGPFHGGVLSRMQRVSNRICKEEVSGLTNGRLRRKSPIDAQCSIFRARVCRFGYLRSLAKAMGSAETFPIIWGERQMKIAPIKAEWRVEVDPFDRGSAPGQPFRNPSNTMVSWGSSKKLLQRHRGAKGKIAIHSYVPYHLE